MTYEEIKNMFLNADEIREKSFDSELLNKISVGIIRKENSTIIDELELKRNRDWAELSHQVVGAELF